MSDPEAKTKEVEEIVREATEHLLQNALWEVYKDIYKLKALALQERIDE